MARVCRIPEQAVHGAASRGVIERSVGSVGDSYDNALAETINGLYKTELIGRLTAWTRARNVS